LKIISKFNILLRLDILFLQQNQNICVLLRPTRPARKTQPLVLLKAVYSGSFSLQIPRLSGYKHFYPLKPQPHLNQITTGHIASPGRLAQPIRD
jgi:hypothetical protein